MTTCQTSNKSKMECKHTRWPVTCCNMHTIWHLETWQQRIETWLQKPQQQEHGSSACAYLPGAICISARCSLQPSVLCICEVLCASATPAHLDSQSLALQRWPFRGSSWPRARRCFGLVTGWYGVGWRAVCAMWLPGIS